MRHFQVRPQILTEELFFSPKWGPMHCMVRTRDESYIGGGGQIIDFSKDGGQNWIRVANFTPTDAHDALIAWDKVDTFVIFCGTTGAGSDGLFKSTDSGDSFSRVGSITGFNYTNEQMTSIRYAQGAGSDLWGCGLDSGGDHFVRHSTDDGSSWSDVTPTGFTDSVVMQAHNASGLVLARSDANNTHGLFDADGTLPASYTSNFFGMGVNWVPYAGGGNSSQAIWGDEDWSFPNRFWVLMHENGVSAGARNQRLLFSDDGTTWEQCAIVFNEPNMDSVGNLLNFGYDGQDYHCIFSGTLGSGSGPDNFWLKSRDGIVWQNQPKLPDDWFQGNLNTRSAFVLNS